MFFLQHLGLISCHRHQNYLSYTGKIEEVRENQIKFTGTPYLFLGSCQFQYHQGDDKNVSKKRKFRETQKEKLTGDHAEPIKTINSLTLQKKLVVL